MCVGDVTSSASMGAEPGNLVRLHLELSLELTLAPRRLDRSLEVRKGGFGGGPNVNWAVSRKSASNAFMCLWKTSFNHSTPIGLSKWIPFQDASSGKDRSICSATSSNPMGRTLLWCICLTTSFRFRTFVFISIAFWSAFLL